MGVTTSCGKIIGQNLKRLRKLSGLTQSKLASDLNMNYRHYQDIEPGKADVKLSTLQKFSDYFKIPLHTLFHDPEKRPFPLHTQKFLDHFCISIHDSKSANYLDVCYNLTNVLGVEKNQLLEMNPAEFAPPKQWDGTPSRQAAFEVIGKAYRNGHHEFHWTGMNENSVFVSKVHLQQIQLGERIYFQSLAEIPKEYIRKSDPKVQHLFS